LNEFDESLTHRPLSGGFERNGLMATIEASAGGATIYVVGGKMLCMKHPARIALLTLGIVLAGTVAQSRDSGAISQKS